MPTPDVRVRLSAEGVAEVVAALETVQAQAGLTASKGGGGFLGLNRILGSTASMLRSLGIAFGIREIARWIGSAVDAATTTLRLGRQVGATVENLSGLNLIARTTGISLDELGTYLSRMNNWIGQVMRNTPAATATLRRLGLSLDDLKGKDAVQIFELLSQKITALPTKFQQTAASVDIFGRGAADLLPTMEALADEGLEAVKERARELGILLDTKTAQSMKNLKRDLELLKLQGEGVGQTFAAGFSPELSQSLQAISGDVKQTTSVWKEMGEVVGVVLKYVVALVSAAADSTILSLRVVWVSISAVGRAAAAAARLDWAEAKRIMQQMDQELEAMDRKCEERMRARWRLVLGPIPTIGGGGGGGGGGGAGSAGDEPNYVPPDEEAGRAARLKAAEADLDRELALVKTMASLKNAAEKRAFDQGLIDVTTYYANRIKIVNDAYDDEVAALGKKRDLAQQEPDETTRAAEVARIDDELSKAKIEHEGEILAIQGEELTAVRDLGRERLALDQRILEAEGQRHAAAMLAIEAEIAKEKERPLAKGESPEERAAAIARLRTARTGGEDFEEARRQAEAALSSLDAARSEIDARMSAGILSQLTGEQQILEIEKSRLPILAQLAAALEAAAAATGDPEKIAQAQAFAASIRGLSLGIQASEDAWGRFRTTAVNAATTALTTFFDTGIDGSQSLGEAFNSMCASIVGAVRRLAAEMLASQIMTWFTSLFSSAVKVDPNFIGPMPKARGGLLGGRGTGTSDSNLILASRGEYLVRQAVVSQPGMLQHLEALNRHGARQLMSAPVIIQEPIARFVSGGLVDVGGGIGERAGKDGRMLIGLEEGLVLRSLESPEGQRTIVKALSKNRRAVRSVVGS